MRLHACVILISFPTCLYMYKHVHATLITKVPKYLVIIIANLGVKQTNFYNTNTFRIAGYFSWNK